MAPADQHKKVVKKAIKMKNPIEQLDCLPRHENRQTNDGEVISFETHWATHLSDSQSLWIFELFRANMFEFYSQSQWGWDPESKRTELFSTTSRYVLAKNEKGEAIGYTHYRFDVDHSSPVVYCYEIQVEEAYQQKGIGTMILQTLEKLAKSTEMEKVMATVFGFNHKSLGFFHKNDYTSDVSCPDENAGLDYLILSKRVI
ncbi:hypothetical protein WR25_22642 [Diploscapter pachys]|uniref:N-alpha-acetyltransferase 40 n=1 Tax=Diploscapter pachys TaxID=2018661 RepID=A0A2A2L759_9BILA|nr:hypothetical protein WR25_22642 [Diploscapter pachys]